MKGSLTIGFWGLVAGAVLAAAACFPDVMFSGSGGSGTQAATSSGSSSSGHTSSTGTGGHMTTTSTTTILDIDAGCDSGKPCDCDGDGHNAATPECNFDGGDCDDHDPMVHPGQPNNWFTTQSIHGLWNYNCGPIEYEYTFQLGCGTGVGCDTTTKGWSSKAAIPGCGMSSNYGTCMGLTLLTCSENISGPMTQGCH
jgi:hypothetical protein